MYNPSDSSTGGSPDGSPSGGERGARYAYLVVRLRNRQITMEEATELFNLMQSALSRSESGRLAALAQASTAGASTRTTAPPPPPPALSVGPAGGLSDDFLLVGLLTMGTNAGLLAAITRKLAEGPGAAATATKPTAPK